MSAVKSVIWKLVPVDLEAKREVAADRSCARAVQDDAVHLRETAAWLCRAHDHGAGGVSRAYKAARYLGYGPAGWQAAYPETTGYIIPSFLALSTVFQDSSYRERALRMADWEIEIQLDSGAVMGSVVTAQPSPAVFNTGQVIFGWLAAHRDTGSVRYLEAARRAGDYLARIQEENGAWRKGNSRYALGTTTYNTRVAWALAELGLAAGEPRYIDAARKNIEFALTRQNDRGWFADNCLTDADRPLLHTILYAVRGVLETGAALSEDRYVDAGAKALGSLLNCQRPDGGIAGRLAADWSPAASWDCVTGDAQAAGAWLRLHALAGDSRCQMAARRTIEFVKRTQNLGHPNVGIRGGVKGSYPFDGPYGKFEMLNWAAKFFVDALLMIGDPEMALRGTKG
jgi:uncharacterized protein YyaL (SSP411 family)